MINYKLFYINSDVCCNWYYASTAAVNSGAYFCVICLDNTGREGEREVFMSCNYAVIERVMVNTLATWGKVRL